MNLVIDLMAIMLQLSLELFETPFNLHFMSYIVFLNTLALDQNASSEDQEALYITCHISILKRQSGEDGDHPWYDSSNLQWLLLLLYLRYAWKELLLEGIILRVRNFDKLFF
jgi:hypothetical protein